ncbi:MAG: hypothetical protein JW829_15220 [Pirellulales bacterium]|nr:hypothetical protein [Pirellulales bacterium]
MIDREPFDRIRLDAANGNQVRDVLPLDLPNRRVPDPLPKTGALEVRLVEAPTRPYQVRWVNIVEIKLYHQLLLDEARQLTQAGKFDDAYDYFAFLVDSDRDLPGLDAAMDNFLYRNAHASFQAGRHDDALAIITSLYERNPQWPGLDGAINRISDELIKSQVEHGEFKTVRLLLSTLPKRYAPFQLKCIPQWDRRLDELATKRLTEAAEHLEAKEFDEAREAVQAAVDIRPNSAEARKLAEKIHRARPQIVVAVDVPYSAPLTERLDDSASRRVRRLVRQRLMQLQGYGAEGGIYSSPLGEVVPDVTGRKLTLLIDAKRPAAAGWTAYDLARQILLFTNNASADPRASELAQILAGLDVEDGKTLHLEWRRDHVRPEALLVIDLMPPTSNPSLVSNQSAQDNGAIGLFGVSRSSEDEVRFERRERATSPSPDAPIEIIERSFDDEDKALEALQKGHVDVMERISPWSIPHLADDENITVAEYALPTVHLITVNPDRPLLASSEMRRAIAYGIDCPAILDKIVLAGKQIPGFATISGPFPVGRELNDPIGYGYSRDIPQHAYEPRLAAMLATVAWQEYQKKNKESEKGDTPDEMPPLILAYSPIPLVRTTCQVIAQQLTAAKIPIELLEATPADLAQGKLDWDLRYSELALWEPVVDAARLLGPRGELGYQSAYLALALRELDEASNWKDVPERLHEIHRVVHSDLAVIPLWQTVNAFAYRKNVEGIGDAPVSLYDHVSQWQKIFTTN